MTNLPSAMVVLHIIRENNGISSYQIHKKFKQSAGQALSFGTLVPMLRKFERDGLVTREKTSEGNNWHLTPLGLAELDKLFGLFDKMRGEKIIGGNYKDPAYVQAMQELGKNEALPKLIKRRVEETTILHSLVTDPVGNIY